ncbi:MAG TPA: hypothetical protein VGY31_12095 [Terriglobia bacterium]|nr:hypothetical protein [Terriglobia bacterium]
MAEPVQSDSLEADGSPANQFRLEIEALEDRLRTVEKGVQELRAQFERARALTQQGAPQANAPQPFESAHPVSPAQSSAQDPETAPETATAAAPSRDEMDRMNEEAQRYARLLVSEIELYNPEEVAQGIEKKDLYARLKVHIDRSRRAYEQRFGRPNAAQPDYFHEEMVRVLAQGDAALLGSEYPYP